MKQLYSMPEPKVAKLSQTEKVDLFSYHMEAPPSWRETAEY